jgi:GAF domain-containing protein
MPEVRINHPTNASAEPLAPDQGKPRPSKQRLVPPQTARRSPDAAQHGINVAEHEYGGIMVVHDTRLDARFADSPVVTAAPRVRFYAGYPIKDAAGMRLGTLCLIDTRPRNLDPIRLGLLEDLGRLMQREMCGC